MMTRSDEESLQARMKRQAVADQIAVKTHTKSTVVDQKAAMIKRAGRLKEIIEACRSMPGLTASELTYVLPYAKRTIDLDVIWLVDKGFLYRNTRGPKTYEHVLPELKGKPNLSHYLGICKAHRVLEWHGTRMGLVELSRKIYCGKRETAAMLNSDPRFNLRRNTKILDTWTAGLSVWGEEG